MQLSRWVILLQASDWFTCLLQACSAITSHDKWSTDDGNFSYCKFITSSLMLFTICLTKHGLLQFCNVITCMSKSYDSTCTNCFVFKETVQRQGWTHYCPLNLCNLCCWRAGWGRGWHCTDTQTVCPSIYKSLRCSKTCPIPSCSSKSWGAPPTAALTQCCKSTSFAFSRATLTCSTTLKPCPIPKLHPVHKVLSEESTSLSHKELASPSVLASPKPPTPKPHPVPKSHPVCKAPSKESTPHSHKKQKVTPPESPLTDSEVLNKDGAETPVWNLPQKAQAKTSHKTTTTSATSALKKRREENDL